MTRATLIKKVFNLGDLITVLEVRSIIIMTGSMQPASRHGARTESATSCRQQEGD